MSMLEPATEQAKRNAEARARRAYSEFRKMTPGLSRYASSKAGRRVYVVPSTKTQTDGVKIEIRPPASLGDRIKHQMNLCGARGYDGHLICRACKSRDEVTTHLHHELAHIMHGSFHQFSYYGIGDIYDLIRPILPEYNDHIQELWRRTDSSKCETSLSLASKIHPHLSMLNMPLEDHRINTASYKLEPALRLSMRATSQDILRNGTPMDDGSYLLWGDRSRDEQVMIGCLFSMEGFNLRGHLDDDAVDAVETPKVQSILSDVADHADAKATLIASAKLLAELRELGFFTENRKPVEEMTDEEREEFEELMKLLGGILKGILGHGAGEGEVTQAEDGEGGGSGLPQDHDPNFSHAMDRVVMNLEHLDNIPGSFDHIRVHEADAGPCHGDKWEGDMEIPSERVLGKAVNHARIAFGINARVEYHRNQKAGRIASSSLGKRAWNPKDGRLFQTKKVPDKRDYEVLIGFDISGSTSSGVYGQNKNRLQMLKESVYALAEVCQRLGIKFSIYTHNTGHAAGGYTMDIHTVKTVKDPWSSATKDRLRLMGNAGSNFDGHSLQFYRKMIEKSRATDKIIMYFTDGAMPGAGTREELPVLQSEIRLCKQKGITLLGVGICTDSPTAHGLDTVAVHGHEDYPRVVQHLGKRLM
ncbi:vWFA [Rhodococcus phage ReqiDocB7]|uniref:cobalamin biosynthesis protein n=1 Tax=Rhodococcus phage ReqiDocB7 TaxID=691966 RepID=UPI0001CDD85D|nr:cobalamin biosynthesis protein [Rhodococcus phage ReqiDocB7]ADD80854.1 vWFA [Rhodococcus phage ReqiDocB7]